MILTYAILIIILILAIAFLNKRSKSIHTSQINKTTESKIGNLFDFFNFKKIGRKIKKVTEVCCRILIVICIISGTLAFIGGFINGEIIWALLSIPATIVSVFVVWLSFWLIYAFGELVDSTSEIKEILNSNRNNDD